MDRGILINRYYCNAFLQVSAFDFIQTGINTDDIGLDRAILSALYHKEDMDLDKRKAQLKLALAWNRVDYARDEIFSLNNPDLQKVSNCKCFDLCFQNLCTLYD
mgnify:FL=1